MKLPGILSYHPESDNIVQRTKKLSSLTEFLILAQQQGTCYYCPQLLIENNQPYFIKKDYKNTNETPDNLIAVCRTCYEHLLSLPLMGVYELNYTNYSIEKKYLNNFAPSTILK